VILKHIEIHATVIADDNLTSNLPPYVINHGILPTEKLQQLLQESKLFIGLGFPYEGPAPLEAIAQGCVFINPQFNPPHSSANTKFFKGKPTLRQVTSQHPYTEDFLGEPHVYTVDINNLTHVDQVIKVALEAIDNRQVRGYLPFEFTHQGMLQRVIAYIEHQDFCSLSGSIWPPTSSVDIFLSAEGKSCKETCRANKRICEPSHFKQLNGRSTIEEHLKARLHDVVRCTSVENLSEVYAPAFERRSSKCIMQEDPLLFSCVGESEGLIRLCPCRDYIPGQTALCKDCL
jgi:alpha-1,3(6)-mannosylglycoprotein beta-1,6-N-acetyl-glucosaminyltransferase